MKVKLLEIAATGPSTGLHQDELAPLNEYFSSLGNHRTARHASEDGFCSPPPGSVLVATNIIRNDITHIFTPPETFQEKVQHQLDAAKDHYWDRAQHVGVDHGAKAGYDNVDDYLCVEFNRNYDDIKQDIETRYPESSLPRHLLWAVNQYHTELDINPSHATTIVMELIGRNFAAITAARASDESCKSSTEITAAAFKDFLEGQVPQHIYNISSNYGQGDTAVKPYLNKASFYPLMQDSTSGADEPMLLTKEDAAGLVRVYDIQNRPYSVDELAFAQGMISLPEIQMTLIGLHEELVEYSKDYLARHPERAQGDLRNFSEVFVPHEGDLLPNPKLLRAIANNILPGIARASLARGLEIHAIDSDAIRQGIQIAIGEHQLFTSSVGEFRQSLSGMSDSDSDTVSWSSIYKVRCPAASLLPQFLQKRFSDYLEEVKASLMAD